MGGEKGRDPEIGETMIIKGEKGHPIDPLKEATKSEEIIETAEAIRTSAEIDLKRSISEKESPLTKDLRKSSLRKKKRRRPIT